MTDMETPPKKQPPEQQESTGRQKTKPVLSFFLTYGPLIISPLAFVVAPIFEFLRAGTLTWQAFWDVFSVPNSFLPGILLTMVAMQWGTIRRWRAVEDKVGATETTLQSVVTKVGESVDEKVTHIREHFDSMRDVRDDSRRLEDMYQSLSLLSDHPEKAPIARFAKEIFEGAYKDLERLHDDESYTLDVQAKTKQYSTDWIEAFSRVVGKKTTETNRIFKTVSNMVIWSEENLGFGKENHSVYHEDQVTSSISNKYAVQRVFVIPPQSVLRDNPDHAERYLRTLRLYLAYLKDWPNASYENRVYETPTADLYQRHFETQPQEELGSQNFAIWDAGEGARVVNTVRYQVQRTEPLRLDGHPIRSFSFTWNQDIFREKSEEFDRVWEHPKHTQDLGDYIEKLEKLVQSLETGQGEQGTADGGIDKLRDIDVPRPEVEAAPATDPAPTKAESESLRKTPDQLED